MKNLIVTRHPALVEFLREKGIECELITHATVEDVKGNHVYGVLPIHLAAECELFTEVAMMVPQELRGCELTLEQIKQLNPTLRTFKVTEVKED